MSDEEEPQRPSPARGLDWMPRPMPEPRRKRQIPGPAWIGGGIAVAGVAIAIAIASTSSSGVAAGCVEWDRRAAAVAQENVRVYGDGRVSWRYGDQTRNPEYWLSQFEASGSYQKKSVLSTGRVGDVVDSGAPVPRPEGCV